MAHVRQIGEDEAEGSLRGVYEAAMQRSGAVSGIVKVQSLDPKSLQGSMRLYTSLMKGENALSPARREMLATVVSNVNECFY